MKSNSLVYKLSLTVALVAGVFSLFVAFNLTANCLRTNSADPLNSESIEQLRNDLRSRPDDDALKQEIRDLDLMIRKAYFTSLSFSKSGAWLLLAGIILMFTALRIMKNAAPELPMPGKYEEKDESIEHAAQAREAVMIGLGIILAISVFAAITSRSNLNGNIPAAEGDSSNQAKIDDLQTQMALNWPCFRGPNGLSIAHYTNAPTAWNGTTGQNILWKTLVPRFGFGSPVVWGNRVFLSCADKKVREVICFNGTTGEIEWRGEVGIVPGAPAEIPDIPEDTTFAASTVATDGLHVFAIFATGNIVCFDLEGKRKWARYLGPFDNPYGHASSLITYRDLLFVQIDEDEEGHMLALNTSTGKTVWEDKRKVTCCWSTPVLAETDKGVQLIANGNPFVIGYDALTGAKLWEVECMGGEVAPSPSYANGIAYAVSEYERLAAIKIDDETKMIWEALDNLPDVSSPLAFGKYVFTATTPGILTCFEAETGKALWTHEFDEGFYSSPVLVGSRIYLLNAKGLTHIFEASGEKYTELAANELGEKASCVPAFMDGRIYMRSRTNLLCIAEKK